MSFSVGDRVRVVDAQLPLREAAVVEGKTGVVVNNDPSLNPWVRVLMDKPLPKWLTTKKTLLFYPEEIEVISRRGPCLGVRQWLRSLIRSNNDDEG